MDITITILFFMIGLILTLIGVFESRDRKHTIIGIFYMLASILIGVCIL